MASIPLPHHAEAPAFCARNQTIDDEVAAAAAIARARRHVRGQRHHLRTWREARSSQNTNDLHRVSAAPFAIPTHQSVKASDALPFLTVAPVLWAILIGGLARWLVLLQQERTKIIVTNRRVIIKGGIHRTVRINAQQIAGIDVTQSYLGLMRFWR